MKDEIINILSSAVKPLIVSEIEFKLHFAYDVVFIQSCLNKMEYDGLVKRKVRCVSNYETIYEYYI